MPASSNGGGSEGSAVDSDAAASSAEDASRRRGGSRDVSAVERAAAALVGYTWGAVVVLPFDRLKTLMQVAAHEGRQLGASSVLRTVLAQQGVRGLYQGLQPHMLIAPYTMLYYSIYGELLSLGGGHQLAPLGAAVLARTFETSVRMPLELVRTQMQAAEGSATFSACIRAQWRQPPRAWFRGLVPTLLRDVPFSAIYWFSYEELTARTQVPESWVTSPGLRTFAQAYCCGATAGMIAALATTPIDVVKTVRQQHMEAGRSPSYKEIMEFLRRSPQRAFAGVGPRLVRIPLGLSTMMSGLEVTKWFFQRRRLEKQEAAASASTKAGK